MDKSDHILAAIEQLAQNLTGQIAAVGTRVDSLEAKLEAVRTELKADIARVETKLDTEARVLNARLDEQRSILAALVPTRLAAVPPPAAE